MNLKELKLLTQKFQRIPDLPLRYAIPLAQLIPPNKEVAFISPPDEYGNILVTFAFEDAPLVVPEAVLN